MMSYAMLWDYRHVVLLGVCAGPKLASLLPRL
jgi:hypothetical protein